MAYLVVSFSELNLFETCPLLFKFYISKEPASDRIRRTHTAKLTMSDLIEKSRVSFDSELDFNPIISASSFGIFKECKQKFKWRFDGEKESDPVVLTPFMFGTIVHKKFDSFVAGLKEKYGSLQDSPFKEEFKKFYYDESLNNEIKQYLRKYIKNESDLIKEYKAFYKAIMNHFKFINSILVQECEPQFNFWFGNKTNPINLEMPEFQSLRFVGEIDHFYINKRGNITIEDTKTSSSVYYLNHDQLYLYAFCLEKYFKNRGQNFKVDELNFNMVRLGKRHSIPFGNTQKIAFISRLSSLQSCFQVDHFPKTVSNKCANCQYRTKCSNLSKSVKDKELDDFSRQLQQNLINLKEI